MKLYTQFMLAFGLSLPLLLAGCGGSSGGSSGGVSPIPEPDPVEADPVFTTTVLLDEAIEGAAFSAAIDLDDGAPDATLVVGLSENGAQDSLRAVAWTLDSAANSSAMVLPTGQAQYSRANGVNNGGMIVGEMVPDIGGSTIVAAFWADPASEAVALAPFDASAAYGINDAGVIVGEIYSNGVPRAAVWNDADSTPSLLTTSGIASTAYAIRNAQEVVEIVGEWTNPQGRTHAVLWRKTGELVEQLMLPRAGGLNGDAVALSINDAGSIVGEIVHGSSGIVHAVRWTNPDGTGYLLEDLGPGSASGINMVGRAVGHDGEGGPQRGGAIWRASPPLLPFPVGTTDPLDSQAVAINDAGRVVGVNGSRAFAALP